MSDMKQGRKRSRLACETCRDLKRKCDGAQPCGTCVRFEYDCVFPDHGRGKRRKTPRNDSSHGFLTPKQATASSSPPPSRKADGGSRGGGESSATVDMSTSSHQRSIEANSGAAFVRRTALRLDPKNAPRMHMFAWNVFMGARYRTAKQHEATGRPITSMLSETHMRDLTVAYFRFIDPIYGFMDRQELETYIDAAWSTERAAGRPLAPMEEAVLCGVAALGLVHTSVEGSVLESDLLDSARVILNQTLLDAPGVTATVAWMLRVVYLRIAGSPHKTWMATCVLMHVIEAAGLHYNSSSTEFVLSTTASEEMHTEQRKRLIALAQHLSIWTAFDIGRTHVKLRNTIDIMPSLRPGDFTVEILELLPYSAQLDPEETPDATELKDALAAVFSHTHSAPPSTLAHVNLALCLFRRLQSLNVSLTGRMLEEMLTLMATGIQAAQGNLEARAPWHHVANVPFQIICVLLSIDSVSVTSQLNDAMQCLSNVASVYNTEATRDAMRTASLLVLLHKRWRERAVSDLSDVLERFPVVPSDEGAGRVNMAGYDSMGTQPEGRWLSSLEENMSNMQSFDIDQFFNTGFFGEADGYVFQDI